MKIEEFKHIQALYKDHFWYKHKKRLIEEYCVSKGIDSSNVLDMGCGVCADMDIFDNTVGADIDIDALNMCSSDKMIINTDSMDAGIIDESFSLIISMDVMQHRHIDERRYLSEICRLLVPGGHCILNVPSMQIPYSPHDLAVDNVKRYSRDYLEILLRDYFNDVSIYYWNTLLLPGILFFRSIMNLIHRNKPVSDFRQFPYIIERMLDMILRFEFIISKSINLPFGVSLIAVCRKTD